MKLRWRALTGAIPALLLATNAAALRQPEYLAERPLETAQGRGRLHAPTSWKAPDAAKKAWTKFVDRHGTWQAIWDQDRGTPLRIFGEGIPAPGANRDPDTALIAARKLLLEQLELLAPGASLDDFAVVSNQTHGRDGDLRTVGFAQRRDGLEIQGAHISFLFKRDRMIVMSSTASPTFTVRNTGRWVDAAVARARAIAWIEAAYGATPVVLEERGRSILPVVRQTDDRRRAVEHRVVTTVVLDLDEPRARWEVYVDAESGEPVARRQLLRFGSGTLNYHAPKRYPTGERLAYAAVDATITVDGQSSKTDGAGGFTTASEAMATVIAGVTGTRVRVRNGAGTVASQSLQINNGETGVWDSRDTPTVDSQLAGYVHANLAKAFALANLNPQLAWLNRQISVSVNENGRCNAYSTGDDIHFYVAGGQCENTGRLADVIYHEFGHSLHAQSVIEGAGAFESHLSEGMGDYLAATMTDDPAMGRGFFDGNTDPLRHVDPSGYEYAYPRDMDEDPHVSGLIIAGALWDTRKALIAALGETAGKRKADDFFYVILQRASEIPATYVEVLAADDDDGDLVNGTPNKCLIDQAFAPHGLVDPAIGLGIENPVRDNFAVSIAIGTPTGACPAIPVQGVSLQWKLSTQTSVKTIAMTHDGAWRGEIPAQADGSEVQYRVVVTLESGAKVTYPDNEADSLYSFYVGPLQPVYCTDFETDPFANGWTRTGGDWEWDAPRGAGGDPDAAFDGTRVVGTDLTGDGNYSSDGSPTLLSPVIDVSGKTGLRLEYRRWLGVEDGLWDRATVTADGQAVWANFASTDEATATVTHRDREWREHSIDLGDAGSDGSVQIGFRIDSDQGLEFGGWNIDHFCIMARGSSTCGNSAIDSGETCDDGNTDDGDGCSALCGSEVDDLTPAEDAGGCCSTGSGSAGPLGLGLLTVAALRRRRRVRG